VASLACSSHAAKDVGVTVRPAQNGGVIEAPWAIERADTPVGNGAHSASITPPCHSPSTRLGASDGGSACGLCPSWPASFFPKQHTWPLANVAILAREGRAFIYLFVFIRQSSVACRRRRGIMAVEYGSRRGAREVRAGSHTDHCRRVLLSIGLSLSYRLLLSRRAGQTAHASEEDAALGIACRPPPFPLISKQEHGLHR
jgi:hypothetical protein